MKINPSAPVFKPIQRIARLRSGKFWNADKIVSLSAIFISLGTFVTFIYQTHLIQKQQYASVLPYLSISNSNPSPESYKLILTNNGLGPALIKNIQVHYKGKTYDLDPAAFFYTVVYPEQPVDIYFTNIDAGRLIPAGTRIELLGNNQQLSENAQILKDIFQTDTAKIEITYASIYEEIWQVSGIGQPPVKLDD